MTKQTKLRVARWIAIPLIIIGLRFADGGQVWGYMEDHLWLACVLPLVLLFLVLFARSMYMQYRLAHGGSSKVSGAQSAKL